MDEGVTLSNTAVILSSRLSGSSGRVVTIHLWPRVWGRKGSILGKLISSFVLMRTRAQFGWCRGWAAPDANGADELW